MSSKKVLIVGGSGGIGAQISLDYANAGYDVGITYFQNQKKANKTRLQIQQGGGQAECYEVDIRDEPSVKELFKGFANLDVLIIAAATEAPKSVEKVSFKEWREVTSTMIDGAFLCTKYAVPILAKSENPNILYFASMDGIRPDGTYLAYQVSEAALIAMTRGNAKYLASEYGIRVNAICPGPVRTPLWDKVGGNNNELWEKFAKDNPLKRVATPEDVSRACLSLTEDPGRFLNSNLLFVNGYGSN
jgi:NAD(P)-dependent dehydrogenase (short-subunit alcohol dehydrogenase family)